MGAGLLFYEEFEAAGRTQSDCYAVFIERKDNGKLRLCLRWTTGGRAASDDVAQIIIGCDLDNDMRARMIEALKNGRAS